MEPGKSEPGKLDHGEPEPSKMDMWKLLDYYSRDDVANAMLEFAKEREVVGRFRNGEYCSRPNVTFYKEDLLGMVRDGVVSFHGSVERWQNPMRLSTGMRQEELNNLRTGWDFIIDLDSNFLEYTKIACDLMIKALLAHGIKNVSVKFSGRAGFHIAVPFEAFPRVIGGVETKNLFPEAPRTMAIYLQNFIKEKLAEEIIGHEGSPYNLAKKVGKELKDITVEKKLNPYSVLKVDTILISSRHLVRLPYSLHEKTWLVSLPLQPDKILGFKPETAGTEKVKPGNEVFCGRDVGEEWEATELLAIAYEAMKKKAKRTFVTEGKLPEKAIPVEAFPPCILKLLEGMEDGRKRSEFILRTFLRRAGWSFENIEAKLEEWNSRNKGPLPETYIKSHMSWHTKQNRIIMPPNCDSASFYKDLNVCIPMEECTDAKNPYTVATRLLREMRLSGQEAGAGAGEPAEGKEGADSAGAGEEGREEGKEERKEEGNKGEPGGDAGGEGFADERGDGEQP